MLAIISDIHANFSALTAIMNDITRRNIPNIICLGDIAGYHSDINECCDLLRERGIYSLLGNHDWYLVSGIRSEHSRSANRCIDFQKSIVSVKNFESLKSLEPQGQYKSLQAVHGGWNDPINEYLHPSKEYFSKLPGKLFVSGHTHVPMTFTYKDKKYCNPGSVGQPRDGDPRASYAIYDGKVFNVHRVPYEISKTQDRMKAVGFEPYFYENLSLGARIGGKIDSLVKDIHLES